jgi:hypothetical protein
MKELFKNTDTDFCSLVEYVSTFINKDTEDHNLIQLPPIQRNAVWDVVQIERLWDSVLRGFPIGGFLIAPREKGAKARDLAEGVQEESTKEGYFLLDGQQRTRSLLLGFQPAEYARLWIDLDPHLPFGNQEQNDRKFLFRVLTSYQPWGMRNNSPSEKIGENQKYDAREELEQESLRYDYQVKINNGQQTEDGKYSWPVMATLPVPFDLLMALCGFGTGKFVIPSWKDVCSLIPGRYNASELEAPTHFNFIINAIRNILDISNPAVRIRNVVLMFQNNLLEYPHHDNEQSAMEVLFRRVNAGGTKLEGEEMVYSLLKSSWDGAYDMVSVIVHSPDIGYLLPSTGIVMAATRLARFIMKKGDEVNPGASDFRRWIGEQGEAGNFLDTMKGLLEKDANNKSVFYKVLESFCALALYRKSDFNDIGLPRKLLLLIPSALYQPVIIWIYNNLDNPDLLEENRNNIIKYLIYSFVGVINSGNASHKAVDVIKTTEGAYFPVKEIYGLLVDEELSVYLPNPEEFSTPFKQTPDGFLRHQADIFEIPDDLSNEMRLRFWGKRDLLLWYQRVHVTKWFKGYNPMSNDAFDTPYDWDHIVPKSHLITSGVMPHIYVDKGDNADRFNNNRRLYMHSIGNQRLWPFWANRSDNNTCHTEKLRMDAEDLTTDTSAFELGLLSSEDFFRASAINPRSMELWYAAGGEIRDWPGERRLAWQTAVENRIVDLYTRMYNELDLGKIK